MRVFFQQMNLPLIAAVTFLALLPSQCQHVPPAKPDPAPAQNGSTSVGNQSKVVDKSTDELLDAKDKAYQKLADSVSKASAAAGAASAATVQNPQKNLHTQAATNELDVVKSNLGTPKPEDVAEANARLSKALSGVAAEREAVQREYDKLVGEGKVRQEELAKLNDQVGDLTKKLTDERTKFDNELKALNAQLAQLASEAANAKAEEARARRELAANTRQKIALGCAAVGAVLFVLGLVGLGLKVDAAASVCCIVGSVAAVGTGVAVSAIEDLLTQPWFWPAAAAGGVSLVAAGVWFAYRSWQHRIATSLTELQAKSTTGAIEEMKNDAKMMAQKLASLNLSDETKATIEAELSKGTDAWKHLSSYLDEWHRDPNTGEINQALVAKIKTDSVAMNLATRNYDPPASAPVA